jgi:hypothetical protein
MKYNHFHTTTNSVSQTHPQCLKLIDEIILKDDDSLSTLVNIFNTSRAIDVDSVEICLASSQKRNRNKTMDLAFSISDSNATEIQLVELKLNVKNTSMLIQKDLMGKFDGATSIFISHNLSVKDICVFIFQPNKKQEAISRLARMNPKIPRKYKVLDLQELKNIYF